MSIGKIDSYNPIREAGNSTALTVQRVQPKKELSDSEKLNAVIDFLVERKNKLTAPPKPKGFYFVINRREEIQNTRKIEAYETPMMKIFNKTYRLGNNAEPGLLVDITA